MCYDECGCGGHRGHHCEDHNHPFMGSMGYSPFMSIEEEAKRLQEIKETLEDRLNKVNKRLETLKR